MDDKGKDKNRKRKRRNRKGIKTKESECLIMEKGNSDRKREKSQKRKREWRKKRKAERHNASVRLPSEVLVGIFVRLHFLDLLSCNLVCRQWNQIELLEDYIADRPLSLNRSWSLPTGLQFWTIVGGGITHLHLAECTFEPRHFIHILQSLKSLVSLSLENCDIGEESLPISDCQLTTLRENLHNLTLFKISTLTFIKSTRFCHTFLRHTSPSAQKATIPLLEAFSKILDMDRVKQIELDLFFIRVSSERWSEVCSMLDKYRNVSLTVDDSIDTHFLQCVLRLPNLTIRELKIEVGKCSNGLITDLLRHKRTLTTLSIDWRPDDSRYPSGRLEQLIKQFPKFEKLSHFYVDLFGLEDALGDIIVPRALNHTMQLESLCIAEEDTGSTDYSHPQRLHHAVAMPQSRSLTLSRMPASMCNKVLKMTQLSYLCLMRTEAVDDRMIQSVFTQMPNLKYLSLQQCDNITDVGLTGTPLLTSSPPSSDLRGLSSLRNLEELHLDYLERITIKTFEHIHLPQLKVLKLRIVPNITTAALEHLKFPLLKELLLINLSLNDYDASTDVALKHLLVSNPNIELLTLRDLSITESGIIEILSSGAHCSRLVRLNVVCGPLSPAILIAIDEYCPHLRYLDIDLEYQHISEHDIVNLINKRSNLVIL